MIEGELRGSEVILSGDKERLLGMRRAGYGRFCDSKLKLTLLEAASLALKGEIRVSLPGGREVGVPELLDRMSRERAEDFLKFVVYEDLRRRGRVVRQEINTPFLRLYPRGAVSGEDEGKLLVLPVSEDRPMKHSEILKAVIYAGRLRKRLILGVVDDELNVTYYSAESFMPRGVGGPRVEGLPACTGMLVGDSVIIWDVEAGAELYARGFWGHPLGVDKPKPEVRYETPLHLSLFEAIYLAERGLLTIVDRSGARVEVRDLLETLGKVRARARARYVVFRYWREKGYVVKPASKYGADFMIYEKGPGLDHAPYLCIASTPSLEVLPVDLIRAGRLATSVRKTLVISLVVDKKVLSYKMEWFKP